MKSVSTFSESKNFPLIGFFSVIYILCNSLIVPAQAVKFELVYGTSNYDDAKCIIQTYDSGYAVLGSTSGFGNGMSDMYLAKISKTGNVTWQQAIGGAGVEEGNSLIQTSDSGYALAGYSNSSGNGGYDVYLAKTDKNGALQWSKTYGGSGWDFGNSIIQTSKGNYVICGGTYSYGHGDEDVYLLKTDSSGILMWDSAYGGSMEDVGNSVSMAADGGYFITGNTKSFGKGNKDVYLLKADTNGILKWAKTYGDTADDIAGEGKLTTDKGFIVAASTKSFFSGKYYQNWFIKTDSSGNLLWSRMDSTSYNRIAASVCQTFDGGYIFACHQDNNGQYDYLLYKTDGNGWYQSGFTNSFGGSGLENASSVKQTYDTGFVVAGITQSYGIGLPNIYVVKTDTDLHSTGNPVIILGADENGQVNQNISLYPNPTSDHLTINTPINSTLEIFDVIGRTILSNQLYRGNNNIKISGLSDGIYFIRIQSDDFKVSRKIIISH